MRKLQDGDAVIVCSEDGRHSDLATFHGWDRRPGPDDEHAWHAFVMVYGPRSSSGGTGMYRDCVHMDRVLPLVCCDYNPVTRQVAHTQACLSEHPASV